TMINPTNTDLSNLSLAPNAGIRRTNPKHYAKQCTIAVAIVLACALSASAGTTFSATTTLTAETSNNTSAADSFTAQSNGNAGAGNVSKLPLRNLMYAGATTKIYAHFVPWFGFGDHMNVGYTSNDTTQVRKQLADMVSRGLDGAIID